MTNPTSGSGFNTQFNPPINAQRQLSDADQKSFDQVQLALQKGWYLDVNSENKLEAKERNFFQNLLAKFGFHSKVTVAAANVLRGMLVTSVGTVGGRITIDPQKKIVIEEGREKKFEEIFKCVFGGDLSRLGEMGYKEVKEPDLPPEIYMPPEEFTED